MNAPSRRPYIETIDYAVLADGWRHSLATVDERLFFARQDLRLRERIDGLTLEIYRAALRRVSEAEEEMDRRGIEFVRPQP